MSLRERSNGRKLWKAETRLDALEALSKRRNFSDVVREAQETVELAPCIAVSLGLKS